MTGITDTEASVSFFSPSWIYTYTQQTDCLVAPIPFLLIPQHNPGKSMLLNILLSLMRTLHCLSSDILDDQVSF